MLSYMVPSPIEDKPPLAPVVSNKNNLQLVLENHMNKNGNVPMTVTIPNGNVNTHKKIIKNTNIVSAESSNSSLNSSSDIPSVHGSTPNAEKPKTKMANGSAKQTTLKRVSFGSSKGSMVETLIYETPVQEEPEPTPSQKSFNDKNDETDSSYSTCEGVKIPSSKVRVSFFEKSDRKYTLSGADNLNNSEDLALYEQYVMSSPTQMNNTAVHSYGRQESTDSGWDNPFRPDGDLSKEADEIVELIKEGKPITPTQNNPSSKLLHDDHDGTATLTDKQNLTASPKGTKANGTANLDNSVVTGVEVQHGTIAPTDGTQAEHVVIKKKPKCKCCSIQ